MRRIDTPDWFKCKETLPLPNTMVIVACYGSDIVIPLEGETVFQTFERQRMTIKHVTIGFIDDEGCWNGADYMPMIITPTYWRPLPEAPEYEPNSDDVDTGLTWEELHERGEERAEKKRAEIPLNKEWGNIKGRMYKGLDGKERTWGEVFDAIFNDDESEDSAKWHKACDCLPPDGTDVIIMYYDDENKPVVKTGSIDDCGTWYGSDRYPIKEPVCWRALPDVPTEKEIIND